MSPVQMPTTGAPQSFEKVNNKPAPTMSSPNSTVLAGRLAAARTRNTLQLQASSSADASYKSEYKRFKTRVREHGVVDDGNRYINCNNIDRTSANMWRQLVLV
jgi:hypothetical protein